MNSTVTPHKPLSEAWHPKVLMVSRQEITDLDTSGVSRGRWFQTWPKDRIAQVYSSDGGDVTPFCPIRYKFGPEDRRFGQLFGRLKYSSWGHAFREQRVVAEQPRAFRRAVRNLKTQLVRWVAAGGLWELVFATRISASLVESCQRFQPDVLYSICTDLSHVELTLQLAEALKVPLCIQVEDDWFGTLYATGFARMLLRDRVKRAVHKLLSVSSTRLSNGPVMSEAYLKDYGCMFEPVYLSDDIARFDGLPDGAPDRSSGHTITYSGSLGQDRCDGLIDLDQALEFLPAEIGTVRIVVFASHVPPEAAERLNSRPRIELRAGLADEAVPAALKEADVVFLPESFHPKWRQYMRYSISSKAHIYMMSGRPALVYGPAGIGVVEYARSDNWAELVDERSPAQLACMLATLLTDQTKVARLVARARAVALRNHDARQVREQFRLALVRCANEKSV